MFTFGFPFEAMNRDVRLICLSNVFGGFGEGLYFYIFPLYILELKADPIQMGAAVSVLYLVSALTVIPGGFLADKYDRKMVIVFSWSLWMFTPLIYSLAENWVQIIPGEVLWGASMIGAPAINAYIVASLENKERVASVLASVWSTYTLSYIFSPAIGGYFVSVIGMRWVLRTSFVLCVISTSILFFLSRQHPLSKNTVPSTLGVSKFSHRKKILKWTLFFSAAIFVFYISRPYVPSFLKDVAHFDDFLVGVFGSVNFLGMTVLGIAFGRLGDRWKKSHVISLCLFLFAFGYSLFIMFPVLPILLFASFLLGGSSTFGSLISSIVGSVAPEASMARWMSLPQTASMLAATVAPYLGGPLYVISPNQPFLIGIFLFPILALLAVSKLFEDETKRKFL
jgi:MFS family permease